MWVHLVPIVTLIIGYVLGFYARKRTSECDEGHTDGQE